MLEFGLLRAATRWASPGLVVLCLAACGDADGDVTAEAPSPVHMGTGKFHVDAGAAGTPDSSADASDASDWFVPLQNAPAPLTTPTYDGSGQVVEPTVLFFPDGWRGHAYWMAISPYPMGNASYENPSILVSEDGLSWSPPLGLQNPLVKPDLGALADATIVYDDASDELWTYYIDELRDQGTHWQLLRRMSSQDGVHWSPWAQVAEGNPFPLESPTVVKRGNAFLMWTVDIPPKGCSADTSTVLERSSADGIHWTLPAAVDISIPGYVVWHITMTKGARTGRLLAAVTAFRQGVSCNRTELFLAYMEGDKWVTVPRPLLSMGMAPAWDDHCIYRSSFLYDEATSRLRAWYTARQSGTNAWHLGYTEGKLVLPP